MKVSLQSYFDLGSSYGLTDEVFLRSGKQVRLQSGAGLGNPLGRGMICDVKITHPGIIKRCIWKMQNKLLFERLVQRPTSPDMYLVVARSEDTGTLNVGSAGWRSGNTWVISFSEDGEHQEAMLLMAAGSWLRTHLGMFVVEPDVQAPWAARLRRHSAAA
jgi:hypothetical protein